MAKGTVVNAAYIVEILDDIGTCWRDLGAKLEISESVLTNINRDYGTCRDKAREMLSEWRNRNGSSATVQCLVDALKDIKQKLIAEKLLEKEFLNNAERLSAKMRKNIQLIATEFKKEQEKNTETREEVKTILNCVREMSKDKKGMEMRVKSLETTVTLLQKKLTAEKEKKEALVEETGRLCDEIEEDVCSLKVSFEKISEGDKERDETLPDNNNNFLEGKTTCPRCSSLENELNALRKEHEEMIKKLKSDNAQVEEKLEKIKKENVKSVTLTRSLMDTKRKLKSQNVTLEKVNEDLEKKKKELQEEKRALASTGQDDKLGDKLKNQVEQHSQEIEQLKEELDKQQSICKTLEEEMVKWKSFVTSTLLPSGKAFQKPGVIGTLRKEAQANKVTATRSSDGPGKATDVLDHLSYKEKGQSCGTAEEEKSWWCVDLGKDHLLFLTHYALRHGKKEGNSILRSWKLEGSIDGEDWKELKTLKGNRDDQVNFTHPRPYFTGLWAVKGNMGAFRYFKIVQTDLNSSRKYGLYLYGIELYGVLIKV